MRVELDTVRALLLATATAWTLACVSAQPRSETATRLAETERPVDAAEDNRSVLDGTIEGLVVRLTIDGEQIELAGVEVRRVPRQPPRPPGEGMIAVRALRAGEEIYATAVSDQRLWALEHGGLVVRTQRTLGFSLPTGAPVTALELRMGAEGAPRLLDLAPHLLEWCREYGRREWADRWCRAAAGGAN